MPETKGELVLVFLVIVLSALLLLNLTCLTFHRGCRGCCVGCKKRCTLGDVEEPEHFRPLGQGQCQV